ncbi:MAG: hypothetical protein ACRCTE_01860 [Cellulosilyticaceae bacterium]
MDNRSSSDSCLVSFKTIYNQNIAPKLQAIDLLLKTSDAPYHPEDIASVLQMSMEELTTITTNHQIHSIGMVDFFTIVSYSSSYICKLIQRQWQYFSLTHYTPEVIAYIYELNINKVEQAFSELDLTAIHSEDLMHLFSHIHISVFRFGF